MRSLLKLMACLWVVTIYITDDEPFFYPSPVTLHVGDEVQWVNRGMMPHTVTPDGCGQAGACQAYWIYPGQSYPAKPIKIAQDRVRPVPYRYHCEIHPYMRGEMTVVP